jgi:hypothetical protein
MSNAEFCGVKWENQKDELYTYFGKCNSCGYGRICKGDKFCAGCGRVIGNEAPEEEEAK